MRLVSLIFFFFFFNDTATTEIYTLSLHDALPISPSRPVRIPCSRSSSIMGRPRRSRTLAHASWPRACSAWKVGPKSLNRSEEHTSELQSRQYLVCRLLLEKKKKQTPKPTIYAMIL